MGVRSVLLGGLALMLAGCAASPGSYPANPGMPELKSDKWVFYMNPGFGAANSPDPNIKECLAILMVDRMKLTKLRVNETAHITVQPGGHEIRVEKDSGTCAGFSGWRWVALDEPKLLHITIRQE